MSFTPLVTMPTADAFTNVTANVADRIEPQILSGADTGPGNSERVSFSELFELAVEQVNDRQQVAESARNAVETGASDDVAGAMILSQKASLSMQSLIQVRNRVVSAYETVFNMPV